MDAEAHRKRHYCKEKVTLPPPLVPRAIVHVSWANLVVWNLYVCIVRHAPRTSNPSFASHAVLQACVGDDDAFSQAYNVLMPQHGITEDAPIQSVAILHHLRKVR